MIPKLKNKKKILYLYANEVRFCFFFYLGDMGDKACPALKTDRSRKDRGLERVGAIVLNGIEGII